MGRKNFIKNNESFVCENCGEHVTPLKNGSCRNHCPFCFYSKHVDDIPGDRESTCGGLMEPVAYSQNSKKGYIITHRCIKCGKEINNKLAFDDPVQPDDFDYFIELIQELNKA